MMKKILLEDALILNTVKALRVLARFLPLRVSFAVARGVGSAVYFFSKRRQVAHKNLRAAFAGEMTSAQMRRVARSSMQNLSMSAVELLRFPEMDEAYIRKNIRILGSEKIDRELKKRRGAIFLTAHFGCWELLNLASNLVGYPMVVLARTQKHPRSNDFLNSLRSSKGNQIIRKGMPVREILKALKAGKIVGMLSDQDGGRTGTFVEFFKRRSSSPSGVATFALRTQASIFPVFIFREKLKIHRVEVGEPLDRPADSLTPEEAEQELLQQFAKILEAKIRKAPDQWLWAHRRWKSTPNRSVLILSDGKPGHVNQSLAVAEAFHRERQAQGVPPEYTTSKVIKVRFRNKFAKNGLNGAMILFCGRVPFGSRLLRNVLEKKCFEELDRTYADVVISCGSSLLGVHALVKAENQAKSIVVMKPAFASSLWDAVIVPRHDQMRPGRNIFITETALSRIDEANLKEESAKLLTGLGLSGHHKKIGLLVGGDTETVKFARRPFEKLVQEIRRYSLDTGSYVLATSSRRTPLWADELLKTTLKDKDQCPLLVIANESNRDGVVPGILGSSDVLVVSGESMSMVSEAIASGKPVIVFDPAENTKLKPKHNEFLERMIRKRLIARARPETLYATIKNQIVRENGSAGIENVRDGEILRQAVRHVI